MPATEAFLRFTLPAYHRPDVTVFEPAALSGFPDRRKAFPKIVHFSLRIAGLMNDNSSSNANLCSREVHGPKSWLKSVNEAYLAVPSLSGSWPPVTREHIRALFGDGGESLKTL
jgi:hypothetical protein